MKWIAIRHEWSGPIACARPVRHHWGGPRPATNPAVQLAFAPRDAVELAAALTRDLPELDLPIAKPPKPVIPPPRHDAPAAHEGGCGGRSSDPDGLALALAMVLLAIRRPERRGRRLHLS